MITNEGTIIRTHADGIPMYQRSAAGVIMMKLSDGSKLVNFAVSERESEKKDENTEAVESDTDASADFVESVESNAEESGETDTSADSGMSEQADEE